MIKAVLHDFDGTLVTKDILDVVCGIVGKEKESSDLNNDFFQGIRSGRVTLIERINLLQGVSLTQIKEKLNENSYLKEGAKEWLDFLHEKDIIVILYSGNIEPILSYYQEILHIDYIVGTRPKMMHHTILGISPEDFPEKNWKLLGIEKILREKGIHATNTIAIGDSPADKAVFEFAGTSIAINPKNGIEQFADYVIGNDLKEAIEIIKKL